MSAPGLPRGPEDGRLWPSPEQLFLLRAALFDGDKATTSFAAWRRAVDVEGDFGWQSQRLLPLVYHNLSRLGVTDPLMVRLKGVYRRAWYETHQLFQRTTPVVQALVAEGLDPLALKGVPLVVDYYRNHALRPMSDVDLLVSTPNARRAVEVLRAHGWRSTSEPSDDRFRFFHALQFVHPDGGEIDLHWHVMYESCDTDADALMLEGTERLDFAGTNVRQLSPTSLLLQLVVHGVRWNPETPIRWVPDVMQVLRSRGSDIDWPRLVHIAKRLRITSRVHMGLRYLVDRLDAPVPEESLNQLARVRTTLVERLENSVVLTDTIAVQSDALGTQWVTAVDLARLVDPGRSPVGYAIAYPHYLRFRWGLSGRRDILPTVLRAAARRVLRRPAVKTRLVDVR